MTSENAAQERIDRLHARFAERYRMITRRERPFFFPETGDAFAFAVDSFSDCLVLEYAETMDDFLVSRLEDGDCFPMEMDEDAMYEAMVREIES